MDTKHLKINKLKQKKVCKLRPIPTVLVSFSIMVTLLFHSLEVIYSGIKFSFVCKIITINSSCYALT